MALLRSVDLIVKANRIYWKTLTRTETFGFTWGRRKYKSRRTVGRVAEVVAFLKSVLGVIHIEV